MRLNRAILAGLGWCWLGAATGEPLAVETPMPQELRDLLLRLGYRHHLVIAGGDLYASGRRLGRRWRVGVRDPRKKGLYAVIVDREMDYVELRISEAISSGSPRERVERASLAFLSYVRDHPDGFGVLAQDSPLSSSRGTISSLLNHLAERVGGVFVSALKEAGYDTKAAPIYANALIGMVTFVGTWWTEERKPPIEEVAKHISALAWMGLRHLPKRPALQQSP